MSSARLVRHSVAERWSQQIGRTGNDGSSMGSEIQNTRPSLIIQNDTANARVKLKRLYPQFE
jgi:hypothetical protein